MILEIFIIGFLGGLATAAAVLTVEARTLSGGDK